MCGSFDLLRTQQSDKAWFRALLPQGTHLSDRHYLILREKLEALLTEGQQFGRRAAEWEKVETYWHLGDELLGFLDTQGGSTYGKNTVSNLSKDLHLSEPTLYEILRFRRRFSILRARINLGWSHYRALLALPEDKAREYEELADSQGWTTRQLKQAIEAGEGSGAIMPEQPASHPLRAYFGEPFTYRVIEDALDPDGPPAIDLGFHCAWNPGRGLPGFEAARPGHSVTIDPVHATATIRTDKPRLWTYVAQVRRIIDGDTLDVTADLGCGHSAPTRLRLRGIDTAELYTESGRRARQFVEDALETVALSRSANSLDLHLGTFHAGPGACCLAEPRSTAFPGCFPGQS